MKYLLVNASDKTFAIQAPVRVLEEYEYRPVSGTMINAVHFGDQLADLGVLLGQSKTTQKKGLLIAEGFGLLVDSVVDGIDIDESQFTPYPKLVVNQKGSMLSGEIRIYGKIIPVLTSKPNKHLQKELEKEKTERVWI